MQSILLLLLPALTTACNPSYLRNGVTFNLAVEKLQFFPLDWAVSNPSYVWGYSDYSTSITDARLAFQRFASEMLRDAFHHVLLDYLGPVSVPPNADSVTFAVRSTFNPPYCGDLGSSTTVYSTTKTTPIPNTYITYSNTTCMVSGDNLIVGVCVVGDANCTLARNNLPFSSATATFVMVYCAIVVVIWFQTIPDDSIVQARWLALAPKLLERNFIQSMSYHAKKYIRLRINSATATDSASVTINRISGGASSALNANQLGGADDTDIGDY